MPRAHPLQPTPNSAGGVLGGPHQSGPPNQSKASEEANEVVRKISLATDGSDSALRATSVAADLANKSQAEAVVSLPLGSVTDRVSCCACCSVLVVRQGGETCSCQLGPKKLCHGTITRTSR